MGVPIPGPGGEGTPIQLWMGYPSPSMTGWGTPPIRREISIESTCYAGGGMPLAFTQEDFLVSILSFFFLKRIGSTNTNHLNNKWNTYHLILLRKHDPMSIFKRSHAFLLVTPFFLLLSLISTNNYVIYIWHLTSPFSLSLHQ